jgi:hypothetical protein
MQNDWSYNELYRAKLWDKRCLATLVTATQLLADNAQGSLSSILGSRRKAVSRILHHEKTTPHDLLVGHIRATAVRCQQHSLVLIASDTSALDFTTHFAVEGLGPLSDKANQRGFFVHSALAMTPQGVPLGLLHQQSWARDPETLGTAKERRKRPFKEKESYKWLLALRGVETALPPTQKALLLQDREADIFEFFSAERRPSLHLLIRATQPRRIEVEVEGDPRTLFEAVSAAPVVATKTVVVHPHPNREARDAHLSVRMTTLSIRAPLNGENPKAPSVRLSVVCAQEETPPVGGKEPIDWVLLTTWPVEDAQTALLMIDYYAFRWRIERFHFVLKSGCKYERLQLDTLALLQKALSLYSIVSWRLLHLTYLAREVPDTAAEEAVSATERHVLELATGKPITTVKEVLLAVANLAGFVAVPSAPNPGVKSLWIGFRKLSDMAAGFRLARQFPP